MVDNLNVIEGPFENINYCEECNWHPEKWRNGTPLTYGKHLQLQAATVCPCCGTKVSRRVGRYVFPIVHTPWLQRLFVGERPVRGWVRWKLEDATAVE